MSHLFRFLRPKSKSVLGIDITSSSVKLIELSKSNNQYCVENYVRRTLPDKAIDSGVINDINEISNCLRLLLKEIKTSIKYATLALPDSCTMSKIIQVSELLNEDDIEELVLIELDKQIPYPINEINFDFTLLGQSLGQKGMRDLLIVASRSEYINQRVEVLRLAGLKTKTIDIESHAISRVLLFMESFSKSRSPVSKASSKQKNPVIYTQKPDELLQSKQSVIKEYGIGSSGLSSVNRVMNFQQTIMVIDIGSYYTKMFVMHDKKIIFVHTDSFGGDHLLSNTVKCIADLDKLFPIDESNCYGLDVSISQFREQILSCIKRSLQFFYSSNNMKHIDYIILTGGVAKQNGLVEFLEMNLCITIKRINPFENMTFAKRVNKEAVMCDSSMLMTVCGLALRS